MGESADGKRMREVLPTASLARFYSFLGWVGYSFSLVQSEPTLPAVVIWVAAHSFLEDAFAVSDFAIIYL